MLFLYVQPLRYEDEPVMIARASRGPARNHEVTSRNARRSPFGKRRRNFNVVGVAPAIESLILNNHL